MDPYNPYSTLLSEESNSKINELSLNELLPLFWECFSDGLCILDDQGTLIFVNPAFCAVVGFSSTELVGKNFKAVIPSDLQKVYQKRFLKFIISEQIHGLIRTIPLQRKDGDLVDVSLRYSRLTLKPQRLHVFLLRPLDIQRPFKMQLLQELWPELSQSLSDGVHLNDDQGRFVFVSPSYCQMVGYSEEELLNQPFLMVIPEEFRQEYSKKYSEGIQKINSIGMLDEFQLQRKDGQIIHVSTRYNRVVLKNRTYHAFITRDITDQKSLELQLLHADRINTLGTLAGGMAHEFNNLMVSILGYAEMIADIVDNDSNLHKYAKKIQKAANRGRQITSQLLPFARREEFKRSPCNLHGLIKEVADLFRFSVDRGYSIELDLRAFNSTILANSIQLHQVFLNLLLNARDAMPEGGTIFVESSTIPPPDSLKNIQRTYVKSFIQIKVIDAGTGMSEEVKQHIFDPFYTTKESGKGTGLGMALVLSTVMSHQGIISFKSDLGMGSTIYVSFPCIEE